MLSYDQAAAKVQWRDAVRAVTEAIEDAGGVVNNVNDASTASSGDAPDFVEVGEAGVAVSDAMRHQRCVQLVG
jgi:hypothetical protein